MTSARPRDDHREVVTTSADGVATITLYNPARKNAMTVAAWAALRDALREVAAGPDRVLLGDLIDASAADRMGLIYQVVLADGLDEAVGELADRLKSGPALAVSLSKRLLNDSFQTSIERALDDESRAKAINLTSADGAEALAAFQEKRAPVFRGR